MRVSLCGHDGFTIAHCVCTAIERCPAEVAVTPLHMVQIGAEELMRLKHSNCHDTLNAVASNPKEKRSLEGLCWILRDKEAAHKARMGLYDCDDDS